MIIILIPASTIVKNIVSRPANEATVELQGFAKVQNVLNDFTNSLCLRMNMITFNSNLTATLSNNMYLESTQVLAGKNLWLFYKTEGDGLPLDDYRGMHLFTQEELDMAVDNLTTTRDYFESQGIEFIATCIPNKEMIYEEYMPDTIVKVGDLTRGRQLSEYIQSHSDICFVYPMDALLSAKENHQIYYRTDTHWNQVGAFVGLQELLDAKYNIRDSLDLDSFGFAADHFEGDLELIANVVDRYGKNDFYAFLLDKANPLVVQDKVALFIGDSFSENLSYVAKGYFSESYRTHIDDFTMSMIDEYHPDVIIWETVERYCEAMVEENLLSK